jgi:homogentisate 1,2-dioxygenase
MIDSRYPLEITSQARTIENPDYVNSWRTKNKTNTKGKSK